MRPTRPCSPSPAPPAPAAPTTAPLATPTQAPPNPMAPTTAPPSPGDLKPGGPEPGTTQPRRRRTVCGLLPTKRPRRRHAPRPGPMFRRRPPPRTGRSPPPPQAVNHRHQSPFNAAALKPFTSDNPARHHPRQPRATPRVQIPTCQRALTGLRCLHFFSFTNFYC